MPVIAIDLGTTGAKAAIFDGGTMYGVASSHYDYAKPQDGWAEQDAEAVWKLIEQVVGEALAAAGRPHDIRAIALSVQGDAIMPIDINGRALHPAILGMDTRSHREAADLQARFGRGQLYSSTGMPCEPLNAITKVLWLERNRAELRAQLWKYVHYEEFLAMKIARVPALDLTMASRTMAFDPVKRTWVTSILDFVGITPSQLGNVSASGAPVGIIDGALADRWGISRTAMVVTGGHDQCMAALGAGAIEPELACYSMGTAEVISIPFDTPRMTSAMLEGNYPCYCHAVPDQYFTISLNQSGGLSLEWFREAVLEAGTGDGDTRAAAFDRLIAGLELRPSPVLFLPHIVGSGTPTCDHLSRGSFVGLSFATTRRDMFQAVADALGFEARLNLENLHQRGIEVHELRAVGGGARSEKLLQLKATLLERPIRTLRNPEAALAGAAMLAEVATGGFRDLAEAARATVSFASTIEPHAPAVEPYRAAYERFRQLYGTLRSFYHNWRTEECKAAV